MADLLAFQMHSTVSDSCLQAGTCFGVRGGPIPRAHRLFDMAHRVDYDLPADVFVVDLIAEAEAARAALRPRPPDPPPLLCADVKKRFGWTDDDVNFAMSAFGFPRPVLYYKAGIGDSFLPAPHAVAVEKFDVGAVERWRESFERRAKRR